MSLSSFSEVIKLAVKKEEEAIKAYGDMMEKATVPGIKELCAHLQNEEKNHRSLLKGVTEEKIKALEIEDVIDLKISDYLTEEPITADIDFQDLLIFAANKEQQAVELYSQLAEKSKSQELTKLFEFLIEQEKSHKLMLEEEYEKHVLEGY